MSVKIASKKYVCIRGHEGQKNKYGQCQPCLDERLALSNQRMIIEKKAINALKVIDAYSPREVQELRNIVAAREERLARTKRNK